MKQYILIVIGAAVLTLSLQAISKLVVENGELRSVLKLQEAFDSDIDGEFKGEGL